MDRYVSYNNKIITKIITSKIVYPKNKNILEVKRLRIGAQVNNATQDVTAAVMPMVFASRPSFVQKKNARTNNYINTLVFFTLRKNCIYKNLNLLIQTLLLSQLENNMYLIKGALHNQVNWTLHTCRPPVQLKKFFDKYPLNTDTFSISLNWQLSSSHLGEFVYRLRLLQMPVHEMKTLSFNKSHTTPI